MYSIMSYIGKVRPKKVTCIKKNIFAVQKFFLPSFVLKFSDL